MLNMQPESKRIFAGLKFLFVPNNDFCGTRRYRIKLAREYGAVWSKFYEPDVTHIIVDEPLAFDDVTRILDLPSRPENTIIVNENFVPACLKKQRLQDHQSKEFRVLDNHDVKKEEKVMRRLVEGLPDDETLIKRSQRQGYVPDEIWALRPSNPTSVDYGAYFDARDKWLDTLYMSNDEIDTLILHLMGDEASKQDLQDMCAEYGIGFNPVWPAENLKMLIIIFAFDDFGHSSTVFRKPPSALWYSNTPSHVKNEIYKWLGKSYCDLKKCAEEREIDSISLHSNQGSLLIALIRDLYYEEVRAYRTLGNRFLTSDQIADLERSPKQRRELKESMRREREEEERVRQEEAERAQKMQYEELLRHQKKEKEEREQEAIRRASEPLRPGKFAM